MVRRTNVPVAFCLQTYCDKAMIITCTGICGADLSWSCCWIGCPESTIFQVCLWRHTDVQADWKRTCICLYLQSGSHAIECRRVRYQLSTVWATCIIVIHKNNLCRLWWICSIHNIILPGKVGLKNNYEKTSIYCCENVNKWSVFRVLFYID